MRPKREGKERELNMSTLELERTTAREETPTLVFSGLYGRRQFTCGFLMVVNISFCSSWAQKSDQHF